MKLKPISNLVKLIYQSNRQFVLSCNSSIGFLTEIKISFLIYLNYEDIYKLSFKCIKKCTDTLI